MTKSSPYFQLTKGQGVEDGLLHQPISPELLFYLQSAVNQVDLLSLSKIKDLTDDGVTFVYNLTDIYPFIDQEYHIEVQWKDSQLKDMSICPFVPCEDIFDIAKEDNDIHFLHREMPNRIVSYCQRTRDLEVLVNEMGISYEQTYQRIEINIPCKESSLDVDIFYSWDYPNFGVLKVRNLKAKGFSLEQSEESTITSVNDSIRNERWGLSEIVKYLHGLML